MKSFSELPEGYIEYFTLDLQKNKKTMLFVNILSLFIALVMTVSMHFFIPVSELFNIKDGIVIFFIKNFSLLAMIVAYMFLHELIHGAAMKICGTKKVNYGFTGIYAYAGSGDYYSKVSYIFIALAPVITFLIVLAVINFLIPVSWFWTVYLIQIINISGAAGDIYVTCKFLKMPKNIMIKDSGVSMIVYTQSNK